MSWLWFIDESGHDHKNTPLEVRGGVAIHSSKIWDFVIDFNKSLEHCFGSKHPPEIKGAKLLSEEKFKWADQENTLSNSERKDGVRRFLSKNNSNQSPSKRDFTAYGQACLLMADKIFDLLSKHEAKLFASCIPRGVKPPENFRLAHFLRKDHIFLQERFYELLDDCGEHGLLIMDQTDKKNDRRYISNLENYYIKTSNGKKRAKWIIPSPIFVDSGLVACIQAADVCLYCVNWGFRRPEWDFLGAKRDDIHHKYAGKCGKIQYSGEVVSGQNKYKSHGIIFVPDPYTSRPQAK